LRNKSAEHGFVLAAPFTLRDQPQAAHDPRTGNSETRATSQNKVLHMNSNNDDDDGFSFEGQCQACDMYGPVDDLSLCYDCAGKFERDMIRQREWDYSASAFGLSDEDCERLRVYVIKEYGAALELIAPSKKRR